MTAAEYVVELLGGTGTFKGRTPRTAGEMREHIERGLPYRSFESVRERLQLTVPEAVKVLRLPARTLARRREARKLGADESDRLVRLARIAAHAATVFGSEEKAAAWLHRPNRALHGEIPIDLLDTDVGVRQIEDVLGRIGHGVVG